MAFHTIHTAPNLNDRDRSRAHRSGPPAVASVHDPSEWLRRAGFVGITATDQTDDFRVVATAWIDEWDRHRAALVALHGQAAFESRQHDRRAERQAIDDGLLQRSLLLGVHPTS